MNKSDFTGTARVATTGIFTLLYSSFVLTRGLEVTK